MFIIKVAWTLRQNIRSANCKWPQTQKCLVLFRCYIQNIRDLLDAISCVNGYTLFVLRYSNVCTIRKPWLSNNIFTLSAKKNIRPNLTYGRRPGWLVCIYPSFTVLSFLCALLDKHVFMQGFPYYTSPNTFIF